MKKLALITILTLSTTMASAKPADALVWLAPMAYSAGAAIWSLVVPTVSITGAGAAVVTNGARVIVKQGVSKAATRAGTNQTVKHSSGQVIDKAGGKYLQGTTRPSF